MTTSALFSRTAPASSVRHWRVHHGPTPGAQKACDRMASIQTRCESIWTSPKGTPDLVIIFVSLKTKVKRVPPPKKKQKNRKEETHTPVSLYRQPRELPFQDGRTCFSRGFPTIVTSWPFVSLLFKSKCRGLFGYTRELNDLLITNTIVACWHFTKFDLWVIHCALETGMEHLAPPLFPKRDRGFGFVVCLIVGVSI